MTPPILPLSQTISNSGGVDLAWGAFTSNDNLEDLAVTDPDHSPPQLRIYRNMGNGFVDDQVFFTFEYLTRKIVMAQINGRYDEVPTFNKLDVIGYDNVESPPANVLKIWRNDNQNDLPSNPPYQQVFDIGLGSISSLQVSDLNNDGYNDIVVGTSLGAKLYLNTADLWGMINESAAWEYSSGGNPVRPHQVVIGDVGPWVREPSPGDGTRLDGWNDIIVVDSEVPENAGPPAVRVFINKREPPYFTAMPQQYFYPTFESEYPPAPGGEVRHVALVDVQRTGGLSLIASMEDGREIMMFWHTGNPAPAPPRNVIMSGTTANNEPIITWAPNNERDISSSVVKYSNTKKLVLAK